MCFGRKYVEYLSTHFANYPLTFSVTPWCYRLCANIDSHLSNLTLAMSIEALLKATFLHKILNLKSFIYDFRLSLKRISYSTAKRFTIFTCPAKKWDRVIMESWNYVNYASLLAYIFPMILFSSDLKEEKIPDQPPTHLIPDCFSQAPQHAFLLCINKVCHINAAFCLVTDPFPILRRKT